MYCPKCGTPNDDNNFKCVKCGSIIQQMPREIVAVKASNSAAIILAVAGAGLLFFMVIGILAAIAIPQFSAYRMRAYNAAAQADLRNAVVAQKAYYVGNSTYCKSIRDLEGDAYGFYISEGVTIEIMYADNEQYQMNAFHNGGNKKYRIVGPGGEIEEF